MADKYNPKLASVDAVELVLRTGAAESGLSRLVQIGGGPGLGLFQMEPTTALDVREWLTASKNRLPLHMAIDELVGGPHWYTDMDWSLKTSIPFMVAFARIKYWRDPAPVPQAGDLDGQARYWKRIYNTPKGRGTVAHFIDAAKEANLA